MGAEPDSLAATKPALALSGLSKTFGATAALRDVALTVRSGEIHALLGHNGSGKSTLIKILAGFHGPDAPVICSAPDATFPMGDHAAARAAGLRFVHQDLGLVDTLDVVDNLALDGQYVRRFGGLINWRACRRRAETLLAEIGYDLPVRVPVGRLAPGQRTGVAMARAVQDGDGPVRLLVLDEPTAAMPASDAERLFEVLAGLRDRGVGILLVTHHFDEVFAMADRVTVLRDGQVVATRPVDELNPDSLVEMMIGSEVAVAESRRSGPPEHEGRVVLGVTELDCDGVDQVSFDVRRGEIVGVAGIEGSGRSELLEAIAGNRRRSGRVTIATNVVAGNRPHAARQAGLGFVPANRPRHSLFPSHDVTANITAPGLGNYLRAGLVSWRSEVSEAKKWVTQLDIRPSEPQALIRSLSGGNQQKAVIARWLARKPEVLVLSEPTQGVDIAARESIYDGIQLAAETGAVLIGSSDSAELARICDRVLVMHRGKVTAELSGEELSEQKIDRLCIVSAQPTAEGATADV
ncbi:sugar ABC transporter ATP-binding protein [Streptomyces sp. NPDC091219]|uniref:sugar ABC transporter ATP-binding protein n=1 Tax=Streptomyces sp. NPDC091219 TaxID=3155193 RepID=UPI00344E4C27